MQNFRRKKTVLLILLIVINYKNINSQSITSNLLYADSLYNNKKYTESLKVYESTLEETKQISPKNILKLARINEGSKKNPEALFYLSLYYKTLKDETVIPKTISIAEKNNYAGWEYDDLNYIQNVFQIYKKNIVSTLVGLVILMFTFFIYRKFRHQKSPVLLISIFLMSISTVLLIEFSKEKKYGIILSNNSLIMNAPTPGAKLIEVSTEGHKIEVISQNDIWTKIKWKTQLGYIRSSNIVLI